MTRKIQFAEPGPTGLRRAKAALSRRRRETELTLAADVKSVLEVLSFSMMALAFTGCANLSTIDRTTNSKPGLVAVHLDAPQRLVLLSQTKVDGNQFIRFCAEPSPDALQSYTQTLKYKQDYEATFSTLAELIGLRTQSITIMRDALYRMCEIYNNGGIDSPTAAALLHKSQDLTAVLVATEQLTNSISNANTVADKDSLVFALKEYESKLKEKSNADDETKRELEEVKQMLSRLSKSMPSRWVFPEATRHVAEAVEEIVIQALSKDYLPMTCLSHAVSLRNREEDGVDDPDVNLMRKICRGDDIQIAQSILDSRPKKEDRELGACAKILKGVQDGDDLDQRRALEEWVKGYSGILTLNMLIKQGDFEEIRKNAVRHLGLEDRECAK